MQKFIESEYTDGQRVLSNFRNRFTNLLDTYTKVEGIPFEKIDDVVYRMNSEGEIFKRNYTGRLSVEEFGCKGDGITDDREALNKAIKAKVPLELSENKIYRCESVLDEVDYLNIEGRGATIDFSDIDSSQAIMVSGTGHTNSAYSAEDDYIKDRNYIDSPSAAPHLKNGDMVLLTSDKPFNALIPQTQGETKTVFRVSGNRIFFNEGIFDTYLVSDNARLHIVNPSYCYINDLILTKILTASEETQEIGIIVNYSNNAVINVKISNFNSTGIRINSCYKPNVRAIIENANRVVTSTGSQTGYGIAISSATVLGLFQGQITNCRHPVAHVAVTSFGGVSHWNRIYSSVAIGGRGNAVYDAHENCSSVIFENCLAIGVPDGISFNGSNTHSSGWNIGAPNYIIKNCEAVGLSDVINVRNRADIILLDIDGLIIQNCKDFCKIDLTLGGSVNDLRIHNVRGDLTGDFLTLTRQENKLNISRLQNIDVDCLSFFRATSNNIEMNEILIFDNIKARGKSDYTAGVNFGDNRGLMITQNIGVKQVIFKNGCEFSKFFNGVDIRQDSEYAYDFVDFNNTRFLDNNNHVTFRGRSSLTEGTKFTVVKKLRIVNAYFSEQVNVEENAEIGVVNVERNWNIVDNIIISSNISEDGCDYFFGRNTRANRVFQGSTDFEGDLFRIPQAGAVEVLTGTQSDPLSIRTTGSPEGVITAKFGAICTRRDSADVYIKTTNTGNTGWGVITVT